MLLPKLSQTVWPCVVAPTARVFAGQDGAAACAWCGAARAATRQAARIELEPPQPEPEPDRSRSRLDKGGRDSDSEVNQPAAARGWPAAGADGT